MMELVKELVMELIQKSRSSSVQETVFKAGLGESLDSMSNQKISSSAVKSYESMDTLCQATRPSMKHAEIHAQCNIVDTETMRRAQEKPEEYKDLVVDTGGFSAHFVYLTKEVQEDVILRAEQIA